jgi:serine/threonine protein kinase
MSAFYPCSTPNSQSINIQGFRLKTEKIPEELCYPSSPLRLKQRCYTTGQKHIIKTRNLNFNQIASLDNEFTNLDLIGEGAFSIVYRAKHLKDNTYYAIKKSKKQCTGIRDRENNMNEIKKLAIVSSGNTGSENHIVKYFDAWEEDNYFYIRTELCEKTLKTHLSSEYTLGEAELWQLLFQVSKGLELIHSYDYIHLDIKPSNLFMKGSIIKIGDFGHMIESFCEVINEGDIAYGAPEVLQCKACPASDIFSLGLVIFEAATGVVMPECGDQWQALRRGELPQVPNLSKELLNMIKRMTRPVPSERITIQEILSYKSPKRISLSGKRVTAATPVFEVQEIPEPQYNDLAKNLYEMFNSL